MNAYFKAGALLEWPSSTLTAVCRWSVPPSQVVQSDTSAAILFSVIGGFAVPTEQIVFVDVLK